MSINLSIRTHAFIYSSIYLTIYFFFTVIITRCFSNMIQKETVWMAETKIRNHVIEFSIILGKAYYVAPVSA